MLLDLHRQSARLFGQAPKPQPRVRGDVTDTSFLSDRVRLIVGDVLDGLDAMEDDSVDCIVTSPPYWGLRNYGFDGQIGLEPTLAEHLEVMTNVMRSCRRVLKPHGTLYLNYGDCFATTVNGRSAADTKALGNDDRTFRDKPFSTVGGSLKPKDLCMVPNRLAIALQDDGWWVRAEIIWGKTNPMPDSSGVYRPSTSHEKIFLLTKSNSADVWRARDTGEISFAPDLSERCPLITKPDELSHRWIKNGHYYDAEAVRQGRTSDEDANGFRGGSYVNGVPGPRAATGNKRIKMPDGWDTGAGGHGSHYRQGREAGKTIKVDKQRGHSRRHDGFNGRWDDMTKEEQCSGGRLLRNYEPAPLTVWPMATMAYSDAHFATFPPELAERCILSGCPKGGLILDPFGGAGTTALVALRHGRRAMLIEANPEYAEMGKARIETEWREFKPTKAASAAPLLNLMMAGEA